jgi:hypothetical protein
MHDYLTRLEVLRHHREELLEEAENARLAREARRGRRGSGGEWRISLGDGFCRCGGSRSTGRALPRRAEKLKASGRKVAYPQQVEKIWRLRKQTRHKAIWSWSAGS